MNKLYQIFKIFFKISGLNRRIDDYFRLESFSDRVGRLHFDTRYASPEDKRAFFKSQLKEIELETHAYCNRRCLFCPNAYIERRDKREVLPEEVFKHLIDELEGLGFKGSIKFHRFNEPLALDIIFDRVKYAREKLPQASLGFHTNGDYLTVDLLKRFEDMGLDFLHISFYIDYNIPRPEMRKAAQKNSEFFLKKHGLQAKALRRGGNLVKYRVAMDRMEVLFFVPDINARGDDRGGYLKGLQRKTRTSLCISPFSGLYIDWTGDVVPCCNLRSDILSHKGYIMGNVKDSSLQEIFLSDASSRIRRMLIDYKEKQGPCKYCGYDLFCSGDRFEKLIDGKIKSLLKE